MKPNAVLMQSSDNLKNSNSEIKQKYCSEAERVTLLHYKNIDDKAKWTDSGSWSTTQIRTRTFKNIKNEYFRLGCCLLTYSTPLDKQHNNFFPYKNWVTECIYNR